MEMPASVRIEHQRCPLRRWSRGSHYASFRQGERSDQQVSLQPFSSDHVPFIDRGLPAVLTIEGTDSAFEHEHTARDTPDRLDFELHREITSMNLAWLLEQTL
jgi:Zn-dependent M28 family amino/carboxypeptidase